LDAIDFIKRSKPELFNTDGTLIKQDNYNAASIDEEFDKL
jgi:hypothetical protein